MLKSIFKSAAGDKGFTLVELSIVIVIIGLVVGAVTAGQGIVRAARLQAILSDTKKYMVATYAFRDQYGKYPGDLNNATSYWPAQTVDGNGDGKIWQEQGSNIVSKNNTGEHAYTWQQLALAKLIPGSYTIHNPPWAGVDVPYLPGKTGTFHLSHNLMVAGGPLSILLTNVYFRASTCDGGALNPADTWAIDTKVDDGVQGTGRFRTGPITMVVYNGAWVGCTYNSGSPLTSCQGMYQF